MQTSAAGRRHRQGKARQAEPRSECPVLAGTPRCPGSASVPTLRARLQSVPRSPLKHLHWRLETEFEHQPIRGGWRGDLGQSRGGRARAGRPSQSWRSKPRVSPSPAQLCPLRPPPPSGYLETSSREPMRAVDAGPAGSSGGGGAGRREEEEEEGAFVMHKRPAHVPAAGGARHQGWGKQMEFGKTIHTHPGCYRRCPFPQQPARSRSCPDLLGQTS